MTNRTAVRAMSRREEYAEATRQAISDAARRLFREHGFFNTKVDDIATLARVSPATVYAVSGGKQGLLRSLMETWTSDPMVATALDAIAETNDPKAVIDRLARSCRLMREEFGDIIRLILQTAPHDKAAADTLATATRRYRHALVPIARRLSDLGALKADITTRQAVDILWFYFGYSSLFTLVDENKWSYAQVEAWLANEAFRSLTGPAAT